MKHKVRFVLLAIISSQINAAQLTDENKRQTPTSTHAPSLTPLMPSPRAISYQDFCIAQRIAQIVMEPVTKRGYFGLSRRHEPVKAFQRCTKQGFILVDHQNGFPGTLLTPSGRWDFALDTQGPWQEASSFRAQILNSLPTTLICSQYTEIHVNTYPYFYHTNADGKQEMVKAIAHSQGSARGILQIDDQVLPEPILDETSLRCKSYSTVSKKEAQALEEIVGNWLTLDKRFQRVNKLKKMIKV